MNTVQSFNCFQDALRDMVIGYPEGTDLEKVLGPAVPSSDPIDVDDIEGNWELEEEEDCLRSVKLDFKPVENTEFCISTPSADDLIIEKEETGVVATKSIKTETNTVVGSVGFEKIIELTKDEYPNTKENPNTELLHETTDSLDNASVVNKFVQKTSVDTTNVSKVVVGNDGKEQVLEKSIDMPELIEIHPKNISNIQEDTSCEIKIPQIKKIEPVESPKAGNLVSYVGQLILTIQEGKDLEKKDVLQKADPYVTTKFGSQTSKSKKVKNTLNPVWKHEVTFDLNRTSPKEIEISLMDWERFGKDEPMGKLILPVEIAVKTSQKENCWMDLTECKSGQILISTEFIGTEAREIVGGGVKELKKLLEQEQTSDPIVEMDNTEPSEISRMVKSVVKTTTTRTRIIRKVTVGPDGVEHVTEEEVEEPRNGDLPIKENEDKENKKYIAARRALELAQVPKESQEVSKLKSSQDEKIIKNDPEWRPIPIIRLDQNQLEITELSDEEQDEPLDLSVNPAVLALSVVSAPPDELMDLSCNPMITSEPMITSPSDDDSTHEVEEIGGIQEVFDETLVVDHKPLSNVSSVSSASSAVTVIEIQRDSDSETSSVKSKPPTGSSRSRGTSRQNSGQEMGSTSKLVMAEAAQHIDALRKKSESSGEESEKEKDKSRWSMNIPITRVDSESDAIDKKRWSVNLPIIRCDSKSEKSVSKVKEDNIQKVDGLTKPENRKTENTVEVTKTQSTEPIETIHSFTYVGQLKLIILEGKDLEKKDILQKADPYVMVSFGENKSQSEKVKNTLTPTWNHEVSLNLNKTSPKEIEIQVMDWERLGKDDPMGRILLPVQIAINNSLKGSFWMNLEGCQSGMLLVSTELSGSPDQSTGQLGSSSIISNPITKTTLEPALSPSNETEKPSDSSFERKEYEGAKELRNVLKMPAKNGRKEVSKATPTNNSFESEDEKKKSFHVTTIPVNTEDNDTQSETINSLERVGGGAKELKTVLNKESEENYTTLSSPTLKVDHKSPESMQTLSVEETVTKEEKGEKVKSMEQSVDDRKEGEEESMGGYLSKELSNSKSDLLGTLYLTVHKAKQLGSKDLVGKSDPYVVVRYGETKFVSAKKSNTNDPEWNFEIDIKIHENFKEHIQLEVLDQDKISKDDSLGSTHLDVKCIMEQNSQDKCWVKLTDSKIGEVQYTATFSPVENVDHLSHSVETSHTFAVPTSTASGENGLPELMTVSHNIQLPEGFIVESIDSTQIVSHETVTEMREDVEGTGAKEVITIDQDKKEAMLKRDITIDLKKTCSTQGGEVSSIVIPYMRKKENNADKNVPNNGENIETKETMFEEDHTHDEKCSSNDILHIRVHKARNLENKEVIGKSDPYIKITFNSEEARSKTINNNLNPEWQFHTKYHIEESSPTAVKIKIIDEDLGKDQLLGEVSLDVAEIKSRIQVLNQWIPLRACKSGEIQISTQYVRAGGKVESSNDKRKHTDEIEATTSKEMLKRHSEKETPPIGRLTLKLHQGRNLKKKKTSTPDPYVTLRRNGKITKSETVRNSTNPEWNFMAEFLVYDPLETTVLEVFDRDIGRDDFIGRLELLDEDIRKRKLAEKKWIPLQKCKTGEVQISAQYMDLTRSTEKSENKVMKEKAQEELTPFEPAELTIILPPKLDDLLKKNVSKDQESVMPNENTEDQKQEVNVLKTAKSETPQEPTICHDKNSEVKDMIREFLQDSEDEDTGEKSGHGEISPISSLPEDLMKNFPPVMTDDHKKTFDLSLKKIAITDVQNAVTITTTQGETTLSKIETEPYGRDNEKEKEHDDENYSYINLADEENYEPEDMSLPPTPAINPPWAEIASRPERPSGPTPAKSEDYERKNSGPFSSLGVRRELFLDEREVSPELIDAAKKTIIKVIEDAKEKLTNVAHGDNIGAVVDSNIKEIQENTVPTENTSSIETNIDEQIFPKTEGAKGLRKVLNSGLDEISEVSSEVPRVNTLNEPGRVGQETKKVIKMENTSDKCKHLPENQTEETKISTENETITVWPREARGILAEDIKEKDSTENLKTTSTSDVKDSKPTVSYEGRLKIIVKQAKELEKKDVLQKADPYVIISLGSQTSKSKKVKNTLSPVWNHEISLVLTNTCPKDIEIQLMDWERLGKDEPMGRVSLPVEFAASRSKGDSFWLDLENCKSGKVLVYTEFEGKTISISGEISSSDFKEAEGFRNVIEEWKNDSPEEVSKLKTESEILEILKSQQDQMKKDTTEAQKLVTRETQKELELAENKESERIAIEKIQAEGHAAESAEAKRLSIYLADTEKVAAKQAEIEISASEKAEFDEHTNKSAEAAMIAREKEESYRLVEEYDKSVKFVSEKAEYERLKTEKVETERTISAQIQVQKYAAEQAESERLTAEMLEYERSQKEQTDSALLAAEKSKYEQEEADKIRANIEADKKLKAELLAAEQAEVVRLIAEQAEEEIIKTETVETERSRAEQMQVEKYAAEQAESERRTAEIQVEAEKVKTKIEAEEKLKAELLAAEQAEVARVTAEQAEEERLLAELAEAKRLLKENMVGEQEKSERNEAARSVAEKVNKERKSAEKVEAGIIEAKQFPAEKAKDTFEKEQPTDTERITVEQVQAERPATEKRNAEKKSKEKTETDILEAIKSELKEVTTEQIEDEIPLKEKADAGRKSGEQAEYAILSADMVSHEKFASEINKDTIKKAEKVEVTAKQIEEEILFKEKVDAERQAGEPAEYGKLPAGIICNERFAAEKEEDEIEKAEKVEAQLILPEQDEDENLSAKQFGAETASIKRVKSEEERLLPELVEGDRLSSEKVEFERVEATKRLAAETLERDRITYEKAKQVEHGKKATEKDESGILVAVKYEEERLAGKQDKALRQTSEEMNAQRVSSEKVEGERLAVQEFEADRKAKKKANSDKLISEQAEENILLAKQSEDARELVEIAGDEKVAEKQAKAELLFAENAEGEKVATERDEAARFTADKVKADLLASANLDTKKLPAEQDESRTPTEEKVETFKESSEKSDSEKQAKGIDEAERVSKEQAEFEKLLANEAKASTLPAEIRESAKTNTQLGEHARMSSDKLEEYRPEASQFLSEEEKTGNAAESDIGTAEQAETKIMAEEAEHLAAVDEPVKDKFPRSVHIDTPSKPVNNKGAKGLRSVLEGSMLKETESAEVKEHMPGIENETDKLSFKNSIGPKDLDVVIAEKTEMRGEKMQYSNELDPDLSDQHIATSPGFTTRIVVKENDKVEITDDVMTPEMCEENLKAVSDIVRRRLGANSGETKSKYFMSTVTEIKTEESFEEFREQISGDILKTRSAIKKKHVIVIQHTIITIIETVSNWLEKVEYRIVQVRRVRSVNQRKQGLKSIKEEIEVIEETVDELIEVCEMSAEVIGDESNVTVTSCVLSLKEQVKVVKLFHQKSEDELGDSEERWEEYLEGIQMISRLIQDLRNKVDALETEDDVSEEKVESLEGLQVMNKSHLNKVVYLLATGNGLAAQLPENEVMESCFFSSSKKCYS